MTLLQVMSVEAPGTVLTRTRDTAEITDMLRTHGVSFSRWPVRLKVAPTTTPADLLETYRKEVDALCAEQGLRLVDVARLHPEDSPAWAVRADAARSMFLEEHRHDEDEVRFFAHGTGCFYLHLDDKVHAVVCEAGDLLSVPMRHPALVRHGPRSGLRRHPLLRKGGRLGRRLHRRPHRGFLPPPRRTAGRGLT